MRPAKHAPDLTSTEQASENNDFCSACNASGYLLCCDGCDRSFHFTCLDPPLSENAKELDEPWFCFICVEKRPATAESPEKPSRGLGLFASLVSSLKKRNPKNFELPVDLRDYFEGVATDKNGAFVEALHATKNTRYVRVKTLMQAATYSRHFTGVDQVIRMSSQTTTSCATARATLSSATHATRPRRASAQSSRATTAVKTGISTASIHRWQIRLRSIRMARKFTTGCVLYTLIKNCDASTCLCSVAVRSMSASRRTRLLSTPRCPAAPGTTASSKLRKMTPMPQIPNSTTLRMLA